MIIAASGGQALVLKRRRRCKLLRVQVDNEELVERCSGELGSLGVVSGLLSVVESTIVLLLLLLARLDNLLLLRGCGEIAGLALEFQLKLDYLSGERVVLLLQQADLLR